MVSAHIFGSLVLATIHRVIIIDYWNIYFTYYVLSLKMKNKAVQNSWWICLINQSHESPFTIVANYAMLYN